MKGLHIYWLLFACFFKANASDTLIVHSIAQDFKPNGKGTNPEWALAEWVNLPRIDTITTPYTARFKTLYSEKGMYVLFDGTDEKVTSTYKKDFSEMYKGDVFEIFLHPNPDTPLYFEYEINAFNKELVLMIPNLHRKIAGWLPWMYTGDRKVVKKISIHKERGKMKGWMAEIFIPFALLSPLENTPPSKGTVWKGTFCRLDYDSGSMIKWSWAPIKVSFHEFQRYKTIVFD